MLAYSGQRKFIVQRLDRLFRPCRTNPGSGPGGYFTKKIRLEYDLARPLPSFDGDSNQIRQMLVDIPDELGRSHRRKRRRNSNPHRRTRGAQPGTLGRFCERSPAGPVRLCGDQRHRLRHGRRHGPGFSIRSSPPSSPGGDWARHRAGHRPRAPRGRQRRSEVGKGTAFRVFFSCKKSTPTRRRRERRPAWRRRTLLRAAAKPCW